jgi:predicted transcriptional regulator
MKDYTETNPSPLSGDNLIKILEALANPHRLRIVAALTGRRVYVSQLAREVKMSRPLLYMHLQRLENAGLVSSKLELSADGKAMNYYQLTPFELYLTSERIAAAVKTLTDKEPDSIVSDVHKGKEDKV